MLSICKCYVIIILGGGKVNLKVYTVDELMALLKISRRTVYNHLKDGQLIGNKVAGKWIFSEKQIQDYIEGKNKQQEG